MRNEEATSSFFFISFQWTRDTLIKNVSERSSILWTTFSSFKSIIAIFNTNTSRAKYERSVVFVLCCNHLRIVNDTTSGKFIHHRFERDYYLLLIITLNKYVIRNLTKKFFIEYEDEIVNIVSIKIIFWGLIFICIFPFFFYFSIGKYFYKI